MADFSAVVILNSKSGKGPKADIPKQLHSLASTLGVKIDIVTARSPAGVIEAARQAARSTHDVVIVGGGDGTVNSVAGELAGTDKRMGVLPLGTFNYFARKMGLPADVDSAFRACFAGKTRHDDSRDKRDTGSGIPSGGAAGSVAYGLL